MKKNRHSDITQNEHVYATFCRSKTAGDVISDENVKIIDGCGLLNLQVASLSGFRYIKNITS